MLAFRSALRLHERGPPSQHRRKLAYGLRMTQFRCRFGSAKVVEKNESTQKLRLIN